MSKFAVVDFYKEKLVDFVPLNWVSGKKCYWPAEKGKSLNSSQVKFRDDPSSKPDLNWKLHPVRILRVCDTVAKARLKVKKRVKDPNADLESSEAGTPTSCPKRKRKITNSNQYVKRRHLESESSSSDLDSEVSFNEDDNLIPPSTDFANQLELEDSHDIEVSAFDTEGQPPNTIQYQEQEVVQVIDLVGSIESLKSGVEEIKGSQSQILEQLVQLREDVKVLMVGSCNEISSLRSGIPKHPVGDLNQMLELEAFIESKENYNKLLRYLSSIGGETVKETVYSVLSRLFKNRFAEEINYCGKNGKIEFQKSPLCQLIFDAIQNTPFDESSDKPTENKIKNGIQDWFRTAKGRK